MRRKAKLSVSWQVGFARIYLEKRRTQGGGGMEEC